MPYPALHNKLMMIAFSFIFLICYLPSSLSNEGITVYHVEMQPVFQSHLVYAALKDSHPGSAFITTTTKGEAIGQAMNRYDAVARHKIILKNLGSFGSDSGCSTTLLYGSPFMRDLVSESYDRDCSAREKNAVVFIGGERIMDNLDIPYWDD